MIYHKRRFLVLKPERNVHLTIHVGHRESNRAGDATRLTFWDCNVDSLSSRLSPEQPRDRTIDVRGAQRQGSAQTAQTAESCDPMSYSGPTLGPRWPILLWEGPGCRAWGSRPGTL